MFDEAPSAVPTPRTLPREVMLIALLLLFEGITDLANRLTGLYSTWLFQQQHVRDGGLLDLMSGLDNNPQIPIYFFTHHLLPILLAIAGIVTGIALLARARWALWGGIILLLATAIDRFYVGIIENAASLLHFTSGEGLLQFLSVVFAVLFEIAVSLVMLYFLMTTRALAAWGIQDLTGAPARWRSVIDRRLPAATPPTALLIGLLLFCWAGETLIPLLFSVPSLSMFLSSLVDQPGDAKIYTLVFVFASVACSIGYLISGVGLLRKARWALILAIIVLVIAIVLPNLWAFIRSFHDQIESFTADLAARNIARNSLVISNFIRLLTSLLVSGTLIYFLLNMLKIHQKRDAGMSL